MQSEPFQFRFGLWIPLEDSTATSIRISKSNQQVKLQLVDAACECAIRSLQCSTHELRFETHVHDSRYISLNRIRFTHEERAIHEITQWTFNTRSRFRCKSEFCVHPRGLTGEEIMHAYRNVRAFYEEIKRRATSRDVALSLRLLTGIWKPMDVYCGSTYRIASSGQEIAFTAQDSTDQEEFRVSNFAFANGRISCKLTMPSTKTRSLVELIPIDGNYVIEKYTFFEDLKFAGVA